MISVMTVVYNGERFLEESIKSVLIQKEDFELIIVNDGSTDRTEEIIHSFEDPRIRYYKQEHRGCAAARDHLLTHVRGEFLVWQDADDISLPGRFQRLKKQFEDPQIAYAHSDVIFIDEKGLPYRYQHPIPVTRDTLMRTYLKMDTPFNNASMMIRTSVIQGVHFDTDLDCGSDTTFIQQFSLKTKGAYVPVPLLLYRRHPQSMGQIYKEKKDRFPHLRKFIESQPIETLIPEAFWIKADRKIQEAIAYTLVFYFVRRKGYRDESESFLARAKEYAGDHREALTFIEGMQELAELQCTQALQTLYPLRPSVFNPLIENYMGEALILLKKYSEAYFLLFKALQIYPHYDELLENLKLAAIAQQIQLDSQQ